MRRLCALFLLCPLLVSCYAVNDLPTVLDEVIADNLNAENVYRQDRNSRYYSYYLPGDVYLLDFDKDSAVLSFNEEKLLMNLNVNAILNDSINPDQKDDLKAESFYPDDLIIYQNRGEYADFNEEVTAYIYTLYAIDDRYLIVLNTASMNYYTYTSKDNCPVVTAKLFLLARSTSVNDSRVLEDYSNVDIIDYNRKQVNLFETIVPKDGHLEDLVIDKTDNNAE